MCGCMIWYDVGRWRIVVWVVLCWVKGPVWLERGGGAVGIGICTR